MFWQREKGLSAEWQEPDQVAEYLPGLRRSSGALYCPEDGQVNPVKWTAALARAARNRGVSFIEQVPETSVLTQNGRVIGLRTPRETFSSDKILIAAGAWTPTLLKPLGVDLALEPVKGQLMIMSGLPRAFRGPVYTGDGYLVPKADGRLIIGSTMEKVGFDVRPTLEAQRGLADWAARWCPGLTSLPVVNFQAGLRPGSRDGWPVMGPLLDPEGLFVAAGHFRNGILLSPVAGHYMADGMVDGQWHPWGLPFSPERVLRSQVAA